LQHYDMWVTVEGQVSVTRTFISVSEVTRHLSFGAYEHAEG